MTGHPQSQPSIASIIHELRVSGDPTEERWADHIDRLTRLNEAYQGQVEAGAARIAELEAALQFYADGKRYNGPNQRLVEADPYTAEDAPYLKDVTRDGGAIARNTLHSGRLARTAGESL